MEWGRASPVWQETWTWALIFSGTGVWKHAATRSTSFCMTLCFGFFLEPGQCQWAPSCCRQIASYGLSLDKRTGYARQEMEFLTIAGRLSPLQLGATLCCPGSLSAWSIKMVQHPLGMTLIHGHLASQAAS